MTCNVLEETKDVVTEQKVKIMDLEKKLALFLSKSKCGHGKGGVGVHKGHACCTPGHKCWVGEGDCDKDADCQDGLKCGVDNCKIGYSNVGYDCCYFP